MPNSHLGGLHSSPPSLVRRVLDVSTNRMIHFLVPPEREGQSSSLAFFDDRVYSLLGDDRATEAKTVQKKVSRRDLFEFFTH